MGTTKGKIITIVVAIAVFVSFILHLGLSAESSKYRGHEEFAELFIANIIEGSATAQEMSLGTVKYNLSRSLPQYHRVVDIQVETLSIGENSSVVLVTSQSEKDGIYNLGWHKLYMLKEDTQWKVYRVKDTEPLIKDGNIEQADEALDALQSYLKLLSSDYQQAAIYLAGKARTSHLQMEEVFRNQLQGIEYENVNASPVLGDGETLLLKIDYQIDDRELNALVSLYRAKKGWMIYDISQI